MRATPDFKARNSGNLLKVFKISAVKQIWNRFSQSSLDLVVSSSKKSLQILSLQHCHLDNSELAESLKNLKNLVSLDLSYSGQTVDDSLVESISTMPSVQKLAIRTCMKVTSRGAIAILKKKNLNYLDISGCLNIEPMCLGKA